MSENRSILLFLFCVAFGVLTPIAALQSIAEEAKLLWASSSSTGGQPSPTGSWSGSDFFPSQSSEGSFNANPSNMSVYCGFFSGYPHTCHNVSGCSYCCESHQCMANSDVDTLCNPQGILNRSFHSCGDLCSALLPIPASSTRSYSARCEVCLTLPWCLFCPEDGNCYSDRGFECGYSMVSQCQALYPTVSNTQTEILHYSIAAVSVVGVLCGLIPLVRYLYKKCVAWREVRRDRERRREFRARMGQNASRERGGGSGSTEQDGSARSSPTPERDRESASHRREGANSHDEDDASDETRPLLASGDNGSSSGTAEPRPNSSTLAVGSVNRVPEEDHSGPSTAAASSRAASNEDPRLEADTDGPSTSNTTPATTAGVVSAQSTPTPNNNPDAKADDRNEDCESVVSTSTTGSVPEEDTCQLCLERRATIVYLPCYHCYCCEGCSAKLRPNFKKGDGTSIGCPFCRQKIRVMVSLKPLPPVIRDALLRRKPKNE